MPVGRRVVPALLLSAITASLLTAQTSLHATAAPDTAAPAATASAAAAGGKAPAWLADLRKQSIRYVNRNGAPAALPKPTLSLVPRPEQQDWVGWRQATNPTARAAAVRRAAHAKARAAVAAPTPRFVAEDEPAACAAPMTRCDRRSGFAPSAPAGSRCRGARARPPLPGAAPGPRRAASEPRGRRRPAHRARHRGVEGATGLQDDRHDRRRAGAPGEPDPEDADIYKLTLRAGELVETTVTRTSGNLEPISLLVDSDGDVVTWADFTPGSASKLSTTVRASGTYYLVTFGI
jgi:hypothetical protein